MGRTRAGAGEGKGGSGSVCSPRAGRWDGESQDPQPRRRAVAGSPARLGRERFSRHGGHRERLFPKQRGIAPELRKHEKEPRCQSTGCERALQLGWDAEGSGDTLWERGAEAKSSGSCRFGSRQKPLTAFGCRAKRRVVPGHTNRRSAAAPHALELQPRPGGERRHRPTLPTVPGAPVARLLQGPERSRLSSGTARGSNLSPPSRTGSVFLTGEEPSPRDAEPWILLRGQLLPLQSGADSPRALPKAGRAPSLGRGPLPRPP